MGENVSDGTSSEAGAWMANSCKARINTKGVYKAKNPTRGGGLLGPQPRSNPKSSRGSTPSEER